MIQRRVELPNWIINRLVAKGNQEHIRSFLQGIKSEQQLLDFERIIPSPELIRHARQVFSAVGPRCQEQYFIDDMHWRDFTPEEETQLRALGHRNWDDWSFANWGTNKIAFEVELDESTVDLGYVAISFETAWSPPIRILERLQEMFSDLAFCCEWFDEDEFFYRYHPSQSTAIARSERERPGERLIATLYLTKAEHPDFFLETQIIAETGGKRCEIVPMTRGEARRWILAPEVELLALLCPELAEAKTETIGADVVTIQTRISQLLTNRFHDDFGDLPF
jgi:Ferredoxin-like domain in Api92-like protein